LVRNFPIPLTPARIIAGQFGASARLVLCSTVFIFDTLNTA